MDIYHKILQQYWGYTEFRPLQEDIIHSVAAGNDTLGLMPTGGGKSITFQVPAMAKEGICLVVTPLISLMKDQVDNLRDRGIRALSVYSGMTRQEIITTLENAIFGDYKFLYVSPERLGTELFLNKLKDMKVSLLVVDESHCISQWGYDFRPSYLQIASVRELLPNISVLALTATATPDVVDDIQEQLHFKKKNVFKKSFERNNLAYIVRHTEDKFGELTKILDRVSGSTIIYVRSRTRTKEIADYLAAKDYTADFYHAGLSNRIKEQKQNTWKDNKCRIMVATNAFGMGIDKADVRLVVHTDLPNSIEEYFQEAGRAGRDGSKSYAVILYSKPDSTKLKKRVSDEFPDRDFVCKVYEHLAYFFQVAEGYGMERMYDFNLHQFCTNYKLPIVQTHNALKLLDLSNYIEYTDEQDNLSRLIFTVYRDELYQYSFDSDTELIINTILRLYTGIFTNYAVIDETAIGIRTGKSRTQVYELLKMLSKRNIIDYIPHKKTPLIAYKQPRIEKKYLVIPNLVYEQRKDRFEKRIQAMNDYVSSEDICRSRMLLIYFGENNPSDCGQCDICLAKNKSGLTNKKYNEIQVAIENRIGEGIVLSELIDSLEEFSADDITSVIRFEVEKGYWVIDVNKIKKV